MFLLTERHNDRLNHKLQVRRSKTPAGWREPSLNQVCLMALEQLRSRSATLGFAEPDHYVFPAHRRKKVIDPTRPMTTWKTVWSSLRKAAGLPNVRFHDGRHSVLTRLAEQGQPDWVIQAQLGHVSPAMMKTYSHIRRKALDEAAAALEPPFELKQSELHADQADATGVTSQSPSQSDEAEAGKNENAREIGSPSWTRIELSAWRRSQNFGVFLRVSGA